MLRYLPLLLAFAAVGAVAVYDGVLNHRWVPNLEAKRYAKLLKRVPENVGLWQGESFEVDDDILKAAGAEGYVSRRYVHEETGDAVDVWLIVGPFKHVIRHTPDICYPSQDFRRAAPIGVYSFKVPGEADNQFLTSLFVKQGVQQVFWSWHKPGDSEEIAWYAGDKRENREKYAGTPALFKLYFTTTTTSTDAPPEDSPANEFAKEFLPVINEIIREPEKALAAPPSEESGDEETEAEAT